MTTTPKTLDPSVSRVRSSRLFWIFSKRVFGGLRSSYCPLDLVGSTDKPYKPIHPLPKVVGDTGHQKRGGKRWWEDSAPQQKWLVSKEEICMQYCGNWDVAVAQIYIHVFLYIVTLASYPMPMSFSLSPLFSGFLSKSRAFLGHRR